MKVVTTSRTSCRPPPRSTYLTIGQDLFSINEYVLSQYNASLHRGSLEAMSAFTPAALMVYTDLRRLRGLSTPVDYGSGIEYADGVLSLFPGQGVGLQIGLWLHGKEGCHQIIEGKMETNIKRLAKYLEGCKAEKIFLRIGYEFDNPSFGYTCDPGAYAEAFRVIVDSCRRWLSEEAMAKVLFVFHSWGAPITNGTLESYYPGDDYVDWVGVSIFQQVYPWSPNWGGTVGDVKRVMDFASDHLKPTMIAESTPFGGIDLDTNVTRAFNKVKAWDRWFAPVLALIDQYDVSMWSYINCNWEAQPMWHNVGFGESRLSTSGPVMKHWQRIVLGRNKSRNFLMAGSLANCGLDGARASVLMLSQSSQGFERKAQYSQGFTAVILCIFVSAAVIKFLFRDQRNHAVMNAPDSSEEEQVHLLKDNASATCSSHSPSS